MNRQLNKHTQPNPRGFVSRMGYNVACTSYTQSIEIGRFSGSSLNRLQAKKRRDELQFLLTQPAQILEKVGTSINDYNEYKSQINDLRNHIAHFKRAARKIPKPHDKRGFTLHLLSPRSKAKLRDKCTAFYRSCGAQKTFCTLTFIQSIDDQTAVSILNKFLTQLRDDYSRFKYIWVAERQENGNIHFHCIFNQRLPVRRYNALWVLQQYNSGLRFENISPAEIRQRYEDDSIHEILNPFDIKKIKSVYGLSFYLTKYITKNRSEGFTCLAWHCSRNVSRLFTKTIVSRSCMQAVASFVNSRLDKSTGEIKKAREVKGAFYQLFYIENKPYFLREMAEIEQINCWVLDGMLPDKIPEIDDIDISKFFNN